ncbi:hypothetical protein Rsub_10433 [Raphidocelis subcapitata]|uniref:Auxin efflux carrier n=1 Tax=Raphidocelis subcapitata TaxID=307507 RepID=A0A2V0PHY0_9CHLO|nr:hypothetical protein Rsub_10433 [Raphidocelis subcapitata]|eukprot:GBF97510.1 hypothetical protein Rsub_10433 [Raphidocelis subcapitata]
MIAYGSVLQTGVQSLLALAAGWAAARWRALDPEPAVAQLNLFVLRVCIPALQVWLLAVKTDMRRADNWRVIGAFLCWSLSLQALAAAWQLARRGRLDAARLGVDSLVLSTNNTGILGPVVLQAALGPRYAPLGMLATVVLYFQQLPSAAVLFDYHRRHADAQHAHAEGAPLLVSKAEGWEQQQPQQQQHAGGKQSPPPRPGGGDAEACEVGGGAEWGAAAAAAGAGSPQHPRHAQHHQEQQQRTAAGGGARHAADGGALLLMARNPMVWSTAAALLLSCCGSAALLEPTSPAHPRALGFVEPLLAWFAGCTAPVTLFCTGLWAHGKEIAGGAAGRELAAYTALRATLGPAVMVLLARLLGFSGDLAAALVILSVLPVAQTAFVICKQYDVGTATVTGAMVASLLAMLPQLMATLWLLEASGVFAQ